MIASLGLAWTFVCATQASEPALVALMRINMAVLRKERKRIFRKNRKNSQATLYERFYFSRRRIFALDGRARDFQQQAHLTSSLHKNSEREDKTPVKRRDVKLDRRLCSLLTNQR